MPKQTVSLPKITGKSADQTSRDLAKLFLSGALADCPDWEIITFLCRQAFADDPRLGREATNAIFHQIIEKLCDSFSDQGVTLCNLVLARILDFIRHTPQGRDLDRLLLEFGFSTAEDILQRYEQNRTIRPIPFHLRKGVKKIIILSRITAGADIAITSVIIQRLAQTFQKAELILIGPTHLPQMFAAIPKVRCINFLYKNDSDLFNKMTSWPPLLEIARKEHRGLSQEEILLFDPDTRMTQLGLLPVLDSASTYYFCSRADVPPEFAEKNLSFLTNHWLNLLLHENSNNPPALPKQQTASIFQKFCTELKRKGCRTIICINFGVGNDPRKKIPGNFEGNLIKSLLQDPHTVIILDSGRGPQESKHIARHLRLAEQDALATGTISEEYISPEAARLSHGLIIFKASLGALGKMITATDCFIGYDSCGQHLASATGTPSVIIFAGAPSPRFIRRWSPAANTTTFPVAKEIAEDNRKIEQLIEKIRTTVGQIQKSKGETFADH